MTTWGCQLTYPLAVLDSLGEATLEYVATEDAIAQAARSGVHVSGQPDRIDHYAIAYVETKDGMPISTIVREEDATHRGITIWYDVRDGATC